MEFLVHSTVIKSKRQAIFFPRSFSASHRVCLTVMGPYRFRGLNKETGFRQRELCYLQYVTGRNTPVTGLISAERQRMFTHAGLPFGTPLTNVSGSSDSAPDHLGRLIEADGGQSAISQHVNLDGLSSCL
jgi:hypothetical protein